MTVLLKNGDYALDAQGRIQEANGREALLAQAFIRLQARKGGFSLDPTLGSELYRLDLNHAGLADIEPLIREALAPIRGLYLDGLDRKIDADGRLALTLRFLWEGDGMDLALYGPCEEE